MPVDQCTSPHVAAVPVHSDIPLETNNSTIWLSNIAMENDPFIDDFPSYKPPLIVDFQNGYVSHNQRVHPETRTQSEVLTLRTRPFLMSLLCFKTHIAGRRSFCSLAWSD